MILLYKPWLESSNLLLKRSLGYYLCISVKASCPLHQDDRYRAAAEGEPNVCLEDKTIIPKEYKAIYFKYFKQLF